jgi:hypothetical protein
MLRSAPELPARWLWIPGLRARARIPNDESLNVVMPGLVPGIHVFGERRRNKTWMAGTSPAMTSEKIIVNAMFTTFVRVRFTNVFDATVRMQANPCVWRGCITG